MIRKHRHPGPVHHESFDSLLTSVTANCYICTTMWQAYANHGYDLSQEKGKYSSLITSTSLRRSTTLAGHDYDLEINGTSEMFPNPEDRSYGVFTGFFLGEMKSVGKFFVS